MCSLADPESQGSTSIVRCVRPGVVVKCPATISQSSSMYARLTKTIANSFFVEKTILQKLGTHSRLVKYYGWQDEPQTLAGLLLAQASHGSLQQYLERDYGNISFATRQKWCRQVVEAISYIHLHDVIHSDLRPDNFLVHETTPASLDLWLCDFGGSYCKKLSVDGKQLPDPGFFDPNGEWAPRKGVDIFSLGSVLYSIVTGHWPHREPGPFHSADDSRKYDREVEELFKSRQYPNTDGLFCGNIILGCWNGDFHSMTEISYALDQEMRSSMNEVIISQ